MSAESSCRRNHLNYELQAVIGEGAYGKVYKARDLDGRFVALKKMNLFSNEDGVPFSVIREVGILKKLEFFEHPNIVRLFDVSIFQSGREIQLVLVFEHVDQDLSTFLSKVPEPGLPVEKIKDLMEQLLRGIDFLHTNHVIHRDLKPENILINSKGQIKVADFGLARLYSFHMALTPVVVTLWYRAPEVLLCSSYETSVDMWSIGCIFAELYQRKPLICGYSDISQLQKMFDLLGLPEEAEWPQEAPIPYSAFTRNSARGIEDVPSGIDNEGKDLLLKCFCFDPKRRISALEALAHPYFKMVTGEYSILSQHFVQNSTKTEEANVNTA
uniref:Protein kinase domain-containing protein n=1 Tax=Latimeria chalumnae TaxID=7897 RepID=H3AX17_LATCH